MKNTVFFVLIFLLYSAFSFSQDLQTSQLGIGTQAPTETLDINGTVRIRKTDPVGIDSYKFLVKNDVGVIKELDMVTTHITEQKKITVKPKETVLVTNEQNFESTNIVIVSENACFRYMISSFQSSNGALVFLNGIARDTMAKGVIGGIPLDGDAYSATWNILFPYLIECYTNGSDHFDFKISKTNKNTYQITNDGQEERLYTIVFQKL